MKKILLVGQLNEIMRSLNECLVNDFQVQICSEQFENVKGMLKIIKPEMLIINLVGEEELQTEMFEWLKVKHPTLPTLVISVREEWERYRLFCQGEQFHKMFRPVAKNDLLEMCYEILGMRQSAKENYIIKPREPRKILLVDDSPLLLRNMKAILDEEYIVSLATSGEQAIKLIPQKQPDLILLDYDMPGMDGKKTFEALKADEDMKDIPVVFLTSVAQREQIYAVLPSRPAGYLLKPPNRKKLLDTIEDVLRGM